MQVVTRVIVQPRGGGEPLEVFDGSPESDLEVDTLLATYQERFGGPFEVALTSVPGVDGPTAIGWLFDVPDTFDLPAPATNFEMVLVPMFDDPVTGLTSVFARLAEQRRDFQACFDRGDLSSFTTATLAQRDPGEPAQFAAIRTQRKES